MCFYWVPKLGLSWVPWVVGTFDLYWWWSKWDCRTLIKYEPSIKNLTNTNFPFLQQNDRAVLYDGVRRSIDDYDGGLATPRHQFTWEIIDCGRHQQCDCSNSQLSLLDDISKFQWHFKYSKWNFSKVSIFHLSLLPPPDESLPCSPVGVAAHRELEEICNQ